MGKGHCPFQKVGGRVQIYMGTYHYHMLTILWFPRPFESVLYRRCSCSFLQEQSDVILDLGT